MMVFVHSRQSTQPGNDHVHDFFGRVALPAMTAIKRSMAAWSRPLENHPNVNMVRLR
jgi:hypothetical protein